jgi:hypothetical protein
VDFHASLPTTPSIADFAADLASFFLSLRFFETFAIVTRREPGTDPVRHRAHRSAQKFRVVVSTSRSLEDHAAR